MNFRHWHPKEGKNDQIDPSFTKEAFGEASFDEEEVRAAVAVANQAASKQSTPPPSNTENHKKEPQETANAAEQIVKDVESASRNNEPSLSVIAANSLITEANNLAQQNPPQRETSPPYSNDEGLIDKNGRKLNASKRAAQNRAAQRAFRRRKDEYIKALEVKAESIKSLEEEIISLKKDNQSLRDYVLELQSKLINNISPSPTVNFKK